MKKRIACRLLAAILLVTLLTGEVDLSDVYAEKDEGTEIAVSFLSEAAAPAFEAVAYVDGHSHTTALSSSGGTLSSGGSYYLSSSITASSKFLLTSGSANVCLNGKTVTSDVSNGLFRAESSTLNIYDCAGGGSVYSTGAHNPVYLANGNLNLYGGTLKSDSRVAIATSGNGTIHIYGGTVQGGTNGVNVNSSTQKYDIYISGGSICKGSGYAVNNKGTGIIHLSGNPTFTGGIYTTTAIVIDGTYAGGSAAIEWHGSTSAGTVVVKGGAAYAEKFTVSNPPTGYQLLPRGNDLVLGTEIEVALNANGGTVSEDSMSVVFPGTYGTLPTPTRTGYTFIGWYTSASGGTQVTSTTSVGSTSHTLYAHWTAETYSISYELNGGEVSSANQTSYTVETASFTLTNPTKTGYTFAGWTGTDLSSTTTSVTIAQGSTGSRSYTATWTANTYTVSYNGNGSTGGSTASSSHTYGTAKALTSNGFTRSYTVTFNPNYTGSSNTTKTAVYTFAGWNTNSAGTGTDYADKASVKDLTSVNNGTVPLYARWTAASVNYVPTRPGYTFGGWYTGSNCSGSRADSNGSYTPESNITLYAKWTADSHTVTYDYNRNGGTSAAKTTAVVSYGSSIDLTPTATKSGWVFVGWNTNPAATTGLTSLTMGTSNVTLYAIYKKTLTATFISGNGSTTQTKNVTIYNTATSGNVTAPALTSWSGWTGVGWNSAETGYTSEKAAGASISISADVKYYGVYSQTITLSYDANGGDGTVASQTGTRYANVHSSISYSNPSFTIDAGTGLSRTGYTFSGWYTDKACSGQQVDSGKTYTPSGNVTLYAKWTDDTAPVIGTLQYSYQPKNLWQWLFGKDSLIITVPVTEEGSGADEIIYIETPEGGQASQKTSTISNGEARITVATDFKGTIVITCTDKDQNTSNSVTVGVELGATGLFIEDHAPEIVCQVDKKEVSAEQYYNAPDITVTVTDDRNSVISGGIASVSWQIGDHTETVGQDFATSMRTSVSFTIPAASIPAGETEITLTATDNAGNTTVLVQKISVMSNADKVAAAKEAVQEALAGMTAANDVTEDDIQSIMDTALTNAGISSNDVTVTVEELSKTEATTDAEGGIRGSVSIASKEDADICDSVSVDKTIDRLPVTDAEKVEAARKVVEEALAGITVTNDTVKDDIQNVIDNALSKAGLTDVGATVESLDKTKATTEEAGSISGSISIVSKEDTSVSDSVTVDKTIARLPETDDEKVAAAKKVIQEALAGITAANDTTKEDIQNAIDNAIDKAGLTDVTATVGDIDKTEATAEETGSISGSIVIVSKEDESVSENIPVNKTIARLPETDDEKVAAAKRVVQEALAGIAAANDTTKDDIQNVIDNALSKAGLTDVTVTVGDLDKTEATAEEMGSISGSVSIACGTASDSVPVGKTIARLPETDDEKVAAAKRVVQEALAGITATNATTEDDIQNVIDEALGKAGLTDVTAAVEEFDKTEATGEATGSISGKISIACGAENDSVVIGKTIAHLPETDADEVAAAKRVVQEVMAGITATNDITGDDIQSAIDEALDQAGLADVTITLEDFAKIEATTSAPGKIAGSISIACDTVSESVPVTKTIAQLPKTPEEKAADAQTVVEEVLAEFTVTNAITEEDLQSAIDTALSNAGIKDVAVTVEDFVRTEATTSAPGSVTGSISIVCEDVSESVPVTKTIAQLPKTPEEKAADAQTVVEEVLAGLTVTNDITKEDLQSAIDTALSNAGIKDVTVIVGDLNKTEATTEEAGSISGSITIISREDESVSILVPVTGTIARLPQDKPGASDGQDAPSTSDAQPGRPEQPSGGSNGSNGAQPSGGSNGSNGAQPSGGSNGSNTAKPSGSGNNGNVIRPGNGRNDSNGMQPQASEQAGQGIPVLLNPDTAVITGESVAAGNVQGMADISVGLELGEGTVIVTVVCDKQEYTAGVADTVAVANAVLTPEQIQSVNDGETIEIRVDVTDISQDMQASDKEVIERGMEEYRKEMPELTLGMYVDISVFIRIGTGSWDAVTSTREPVEVVLGIPEELREDGREFYIVRSHEGEYALLEDMDDAADTITISTDRFSAYAIAYRQADGTEVHRCGLCHICPTFLGICCFIWLAVFLAAVLAIVWISRRRKQKSK